jgi:hypothetical protein
MPCRYDLQLGKCPAAFMRDLVNATSSIETDLCGHPAAEIINTYRASQIQILEPIQILLID